MRRLLDFLYRQREIGVFLALQLLSVWLFVNYNQRPNTTFLNSSNELSAKVNQSSEGVADYFELVEINERLSRENLLLQQKLQSLTDTPVAYLDTVNRYKVVGAKVVANSINRSTNFLTISAGLADSVSEGMGVISSSGVIGQVKSVSSNFSTVYSLLHPNLLVSSKLKRTQTMGTVQWDQRDFYHAQLKYIPRHIKIEVGDTVITSGFNSVFPEGIVVGTVSDFNLENQMTFYEASIELATDFASIDYVYVIRDVLKDEKDSLELL